MTGTVLILGATGRFGRAATQAFAAGGWSVVAASRKGAASSVRGARAIACDTMDKEAVMAAAKGADVIVHAVNPTYHKWASQLPDITANVIAAGLSSGATVMIPGNVYPFGEAATEVFRERDPRNPSTRKGALRVTMERAFESASRQGLRTVILRSGDYIEREKSGNWFDGHMANKVHKGVFTYPGPMDRVHAWAYLPDKARAMVGLAEMRAELPAFTTIGFDGYSLTGGELKAAVALAVGQPLKLGRIPWRLLRVLGVFSPLIHELIEMRHLWIKPHRVDGEELCELLPDFRPTPLHEALTGVLSQEALVKGLNRVKTPRSA